MAKVKIGKWEIDEAELDRQHAEAVKRGKERIATEPQASTVNYDRASDRLVIELKNGTTFIVPCELVQGLRGAAPDDIAAVELTPRGAALHWGKLDVDISLAGLLAGVFGTKAWMTELDRKSRSVTAKAKVSASRVTSKKGGHPSKTKPMIRKRA